MKLYRVQRGEQHPYWEVIHDNAQEPLALCMTRNAAERVAAALNAARRAKEKKP